MISSSYLPILAATAPAAMLSAAFAGSSTLAATPALAAGISATLAGGSTFVAQAGTAANLSATLAGSSALGAAPLYSMPLSAAFAGSSSLAGTAAYSARPAAAFAGSSAFVANIGNSIALAATLPGSSSLAATPSLATSISGLAAGSSSFVAKIATVIQVSADFPGTSSFAASPSYAYHLAGEMRAESSFLAAGTYRTVNPPDPEETSWLLGGLGGVVVTPTSPAGFDYTIATVLLNAGRRCAFAPDAPLVATVWGGRDSRPLFSPSATWIQAGDGTLAVTFAATDTAGLEPGSYRFQLAVGRRGGRLIAYDGTFEVTEAPGSATLREPYCTGADLLLYYDQLPAIQNRTSDEADFLEQRVAASDELDRQIVLRYDPRPGFVRVRSDAWDARTCGFDVPDPTIRPPTERQVEAYLRAGGLLRERMLVEIVAKRAIALVLERQETTGRNPYRDEAARFRMMADDLFKYYRPQLDITDPPDGVPDLELCGRDVTFLTQAATS